MMSPFNDPTVRAKLGQSKARVTDSVPEIENVIISTIAWAGRDGRWTWALFRTTHIGRELYAEIPQEPTEGYEVDQEVLKGIFHLYPEIQYITAHPQMIAFWPSIECKFKRIPKPHSKGTRLALVSFKQRDVYREDEISREEQLQKLMGATKMNDEQHDHEIALSAQAEAEQEAAQWEELGKSHFTDDKKWWASVGDIKALYKETAIMKSNEWNQYIHTALQVKSLKDIESDKGDATLDTLRSCVKDTYGKQEWWRNVDNVASLQHHLINTGLPQSLSIAPSNVMIEACCAISVGSVVEWGQSGKTGQEFIKAVKAAWEKKVDELYAKKGKEEAEKGKVAIPTPDAHPASVEPPKNGQETANPNPIQEEPKVMQNHVESPVVVFPSRNGGTVYKGIQFSVTMRVGGTFAQALALMDEFAKYPEYVAADCKVAGRIVPQENAAPAVVQPNAATAPEPEPTPAAGDDVKVEKIAQVIMHSKDTAEGKQITYDLMPMLGNGKIGTYRTVTLRNSHDLDKLTACGVNLADIKPELPYSVSIECGWKNGKEYQPGKYYRDLVYLKPIAMAASA